MCEGEGFLVCLFYAYEIGKTIIIGGAVIGLVWFFARNRIVIERKK